MLLRIDHTTHYRYAAFVGWTPHLLRFLPRTTPGLHLLKSSLAITPTALLTWNLDLLGNIVGRALFLTEGAELKIESSILLEQQLTNPFDFLLEERAGFLPLDYSEQECSQLAPFLLRNIADEALLSDWVKPFVTRNTGLSGQAATLDTLLSMNAACRAQFRYATRYQEGVLSIAELLRQGEGTCRDFAQLMIEVSRSLGIAARYVSGYLCSSPGNIGESHTHGWCELYLPGAGWRGFDPTNGILAGSHHIAVAVAVNAGEIPPVEGSYCGAPNLCSAHDVIISARELFPGEELSLNQRFPNS